MSSLVHVPSHLQFLLALANPPIEGTLAHASAYIISLAETPKEPGTLTWKKMLEEEPFEGEPFTIYHLEASRIGNSELSRERQMLLSGEVVSPCSSGPPQWEPLHRKLPSELLGQRKLKVIDNFGNECVEFENTTNFRD
ncbi:hypothetical protein F5146DRAFT_1001344 [Armillaria mellea]|nr:hypothetical protein F5146DRAFT_1001344 [Armillaria mellea]